MKKSMYSTDIIWYDTTVKSAIEKLGEKYPNAIPVFGGALSAYNAIKSGNFDGFVRLMFDAIDCAKFYGWHESANDVAIRFCHLCYVDPMLVKVYLAK